MVSSGGIEYIESFPKLKIRSEIRPAVALFRLGTTHASMYACMCIYISIYMYNRHCVISDRGSWSCVCVCARARLVSARVFSCEYSLLYFPLILPLPSWNPSGSPPNPSSSPSNPYLISERWSTWFSPRVSKRLSLTLSVPPKSINQNSEKCRLFWWVEKLLLQLPYDWVHRWAWLATRFASTAHPWIHDVAKTRSWARTGEYFRRHFSTGELDYTAPQRCQTARRALHGISRRRRTQFRDSLLHSFTKASWNHTCTRAASTSTALALTEKQS